MSEPLLYLPKSVAPSDGWEQKPEAEKPKPSMPTTNMVEAPGRKPGTTSGTYVGDLVAMAKTIWLCWSCRYKFDHKTAGYFYEKNLRVTGRCDGCKEHRPDSHLFIHESLICDEGGKIRHGHVWTPR